MSEVTHRLRLRLQRPCTAKACVVRPLHRTRQCEHMHSRASAKARARRSQAAARRCEGVRCAGQGRAGQGRAGQGRAGQCSHPDGQDRVGRVLHPRRHAQCMVRAPILRAKCPIGRPSPDAAARPGQSRGIALHWSGHCRQAAVPKAQWSFSRTNESTKLPPRRMRLSAVPPPTHSHTFPTMLYSPYL